MRNWSERLPVVLALLLHGLAANRLIVAVPAILLVLFAPFRPRVTEGGGWLTVGVGALLGAGVGLILPMPSGPFPVVPMSGVAGSVVALTVYFSLGESWIYAWISAFIAVVLAGHAPLTPVLAAEQGAVALGILACFLGRVRASWKTLVFLGIVAGGTLSLGTAVAAGQGVLAGMVVGLMQGELFALGLGSMGNLGVPPVSVVSPSDRLVMEVGGTTPDRLRGGVLDQFDGETWTPSDEIEKSGDAFSGEPVFEGELYLRQGVQRFLPVPNGILTVDGRNPLLSRGGLVVGSASWGDRKQLTWGMGLPTGAPGPTATFLPETLRPLLAELAVPLSLSGHSPHEKSKIVEHYLSSEFRYSLATNLRGSEPPLVVLLREHRPAYCIYFASAMAALLRTEGLSTRLVTGYLVETTNPYTGRAPVREKDAHAWVEVWIPEERVWRTYDPTPAIEAEETPSSLDRFRDAVHSWLEWQFLRFTTHPAETLQGLLLSWPVLGTLTLAIGYAIYQRLQGTTKEQTRWRPPADLPPTLWPAYRRYESLLRRAGLNPDPAEADEVLLEKLREKAGDAVADAAAEFLVAYQRARFRGDADPGLEARLGELERRVRG